MSTVKAAYIDHRYQQIFLAVAKYLPISTNVSVNMIVLSFTSQLWLRLESEISLVVGPRRKMIMRRPSLGKVSTDVRNLNWLDGLH